MEIFDHMVGAVANEAGLSTPTIRLYCDLGLLPFITTRNGTRLLRADAGALAKRIHAERLANRGRKAAA